MAKYDLAIILGSGWSFDPSKTNKKILVLPRTHLYEGYGLDAVVDPIRTARLLGIKTIILTNAAGGLKHKPGTVCLIKDHINLTGQSPITGKNFIDMSDVYTSKLRETVQNVQNLPEAVYAQFIGPQYETPAEVKMAEILGADLVGMSTALEAISAKEAGMDVIGLSLVSNWAAGISSIPLSHDEVLQTGAESADYLNDLLTKICNAL